MDKTFTAPQSGGGGDPERGGLRDRLRGTRLSLDGFYLSNLNDVTFLWDSAERYAALAREAPEGATRQRYSRLSTEFTALASSLLRELARASGEALRLPALGRPACPMAAD